MNQNKNILLICLLFGVIIVLVSVLVIKDSNNNHGSVNVNQISLSNINSHKAFKYISGSTISTLVLPGEGFQMSIPDTFFTLNENDKNKYQPDTLSYWYDCGLFYKDSANSTGFYVNTVPLGPCASEKMYSTVNDPIMLGGISGLCSRMNILTTYAGCGSISTPPVGFQGVLYYEYIPAYGYDGVGTIVKSYYLEKADGSKVLFSFIPDNKNQHSIKEADLKKSFTEILDGKAQTWLRVKDQLNIMDGIVQSIK